MILTAFVIVTSSGAESMSSKSNCLSIIVNRCRLSFTPNINALSDVDEDDSDSDGTPDDGKAKSKKSRKKRRKSAKLLKITFPENSLVKRITVNECLELLL